MSASAATSDAFVPAARSCVRASVTAAVSLAGVGVAVGVTAFDATAETGGPVFTLTGAWWSVLGEILIRNLSAALLLFSGVATVGLTTVVGLLFTAIWVGAGFQAMLASGGLESLSPMVLTYIPLEFGGVLIAAVAGLLPLGHALSNFTGDESQRHVGVFSHAPEALKWLSVSVGLICLGAAIEVLVIVTR